MAGKTYSVLVVEDDKLLSDLLARKFTAEKFKILYAPTGERALEILKEEKPDLILLDILLPGIDGFEVLRQAKASQMSADIPVIILSNLGQESDIEMGKKLGAVEFLVKVSLTLDEIVEKVRAVCSSLPVAASTTK